MRMPNFINILCHNFSYLYLTSKDDIVGGRFSLRGAELGWAKSWMWSLGMTEENTAKFKRTKNTIPTNVVQCTKRALHLMGMQKKFEFFTIFK